MAILEYDFGDDNQQNTATKPQVPPQAPNQANPLVSFFQGVGGIPGGVIRGAQRSLADIGTTIGSVPGMQGVQDWATKTSQDVNMGEPNLEGRPIRQAINAVAENVGGLAAPALAGLAAVSAAPEAAVGASATELAAAANTARLAGAAGGAAGMAPIQYGSAKSEAIARGADDATANRIAMESAVAGSALFAIPMHQMLIGGSTVESMLRQAAVNAGFGGAMSYGQEELMKANDVRTLPDGQEFNNTLYSTLIGGLTGAVFGGLSPNELSSKASAVVDSHVSPTARAQLAAEYVKGGMTQEQADAKALFDVEQLRPKLIQDMQNLLVKAQLTRGKLLKGSYDAVNQDIKVEPQQLYVTNRNEGGLTSEINLTYPTMPKEVTLEASRVINTAFGEMARDEKGNVKADEATGFPIIKASTANDLPMIMRIALLNEVGERLQKGELNTDLIAKIQQRKLDSLNPNRVYYLGKNPEKPEGEEVFHPSMGLRTEKELSENAAQSGGKINPEGFEIVHAGDEEGAHDLWERVMKSIGVRPIEPAIQPAAPAPLENPELPVIQGEQEQITPEIQGNQPNIQQAPELPAPVITPEAHQPVPELPAQPEQTEIPGSDKTEVEHLNIPTSVVLPDMEVPKIDGKGTIAAQATPAEAKIENLISALPGKDNVNDKDLNQLTDLILKNTKDISQDKAEDIAKQYMKLQDQKSAVLTAHVISQLSPSHENGIKTEEIDPQNIRSLPLKLAFHAATSLGQQENFVAWAKSHYRQDFEGKFKTGKPAGITDEVVQRLYSSKYTQDLIKLIATDNMAGATKELYGISQEAMQGLVQKGLMKPTGKRSDLQGIAEKLGLLYSLASEENDVNGQKTVLGTEQEHAPSGAPGTPDEWRVRDNFNKQYIGQLQAWGLPMPHILDRRPELAFTNILKQVAGDRGMNLMMWTKRELEQPSFEAMLKAGVLDDSVKTNALFGFSPRVHDMKGLQKEQSGGRGGTGGDPTKASSIAMRESHDFSDFYERSQQQGLQPIGNYFMAMHEYIQNSLSKSLQYQDLNWMRLLRIPANQSSNLKLPKENDEIRHVINNLNYVEHQKSPNIVKLAELTGMKENDVLMHLGYYNKEDAFGLSGWDKFAFEKPFVQSSLGDLLKYIYPNGFWQRPGVGTFTRLTNIPKYLMVTADPIQHTFLFASSILTNAGWKMPIVMGKFAITAGKALANMPFAAWSTMKGEPQTRFPLILGGGSLEPGFENMENLAKFLPHGSGATMLSGLTDGLFQDEKIQKYLIPEQMTGRQGWDAAAHSSLSAMKIVFGHFLSREIYNVTNERYNYFRKLVGPDGKLTMTDEEAARRAVNLVNSTSGAVHPADFGPNGPAWSLLTFARGLTIAPLRVISGIMEPTFRKLYGKDNTKFKIDPFNGVINPISMGNLHPKDADFLQAYYAQHLAKVIALRVLAAGAVQYAMSFMDDDKKDEYGQQGNDLGNKKRFIYNNPEGFRMGIRTPWTDINGRRIMLNPTFLREGPQLVDAAGFERYHFPESTINWMKNRLNVWEGLIYGMLFNVDLGTGQAIPGKGTDEWTDEMTKYLTSKVMPLSLGVTSEEKTQRIPNQTSEMANRAGAFFLGTTPSTAPKGWYEGYDEANRIEKEYQMRRIQAKEDLDTLSKQEVLNKQLTQFFTAKDRQNAANHKDTSWEMNQVLQKMRAGNRMMKQKEEEQQPMETLTTGQ